MELKNCPLIRRLMLSWWVVAGLLAGVGASSRWSSRPALAAPGVNPDQAVLLFCLVCLLSGLVVQLPCLVILLLSGFDFIDSSK